jgi:lipopolysaccharide assembly outer membrane protein LptD (OstA)
LGPAIAISAETTTCPADLSAASALPKFTATKQDQINISADSTRASTDSNSVFQGNVVIEQHQRRIHTDYAEYSDKQQQVTLKGNIQVNNNSMELTAQRGQIDMENKESTFDNIDFNLKSSGLRGHADSIAASKD